MNERSASYRGRHRRRGFIILSGNFLLSFSTCRSPFSPEIKAADGVHELLFVDVETLIDPSMQTTVYR